MSRRAVLGIAVVLAFVGGYLLLQSTRAVNAARAGAAPPNAAPAERAGNTNEAATPSADRSSSEATASKTAEPTPEPERSAATIPAPAAPQDGVTEVDPHKAFGSKNAPVVMEVFSDYQCPACKAFYESTNRLLMDNYVSTGKVYLIHRDFPLQMHAYSRVAARYARAAADIGKVEPVEKALFDNQEKWEQSGDVDGTVAAVLSPAEMAKVRALAKGGTLDPLIDRDYQLGMGYRVGSTPTTVFHYKGQTYPYAGGMSYEMLHTFLDQLLNQK